jgi:hypothetical protein
MGDAMITPLRPHLWRYRAVGVQIAGGLTTEVVTNGIITHC